MVLTPYLMYSLVGSDTVTDMQTEFEFTLPKGYIDADGQVHQQGRMRLAMAIDEVETMQHPNVQRNESYVPILLLSRVVTHLGGFSPVPAQVIEGLFASDLAHLQDLYMRLNSSDPVMVGAICPHCNQQFQLQVAPLG